MFKRQTAMQQDQIQAAKEKFISIVTDNDSLQEFKEVLTLTKYANLSQILFSFLENYWSFQDLFNNDDFQPTEGFDPRIIKRDSCIVMRFMNDENQVPEPITKEIPESLVHQLYRFYASFIAVGAPIMVPFVDEPTREAVATNVMVLCNQPSISNTVFDPIADIVLEALFSKCFPKYCTAKGISIPILKAIQQQHKEWEQYVNSELQETQSISSQDSSTGIKKKKESIWKSMFRKEEVEVKATRESMIQVIQNPKLYAEFSQFVKVLSINKDTHCEENLVCLESFTKLESRTRITDPLPPSFERFLESSASDSEKDKPIPVTIAPLFLFFHRMFVIPDSPFEVNVTHTLRKQIDLQLRDIQTNMVSRSIMDPVIDHVLDLLYQNSFLKFVKARDQK
jgi:hypothetical protein